MDDYENLDLEISKLEDEAKILSTFVKGISDTFKSKSMLISLGMSEDRYFSALKSLSDKGKVTGVNGKGGAMLLLTTFTGLSFHDAFYELSLGKRVTCDSLQCIEKDSLKYFLQRDRCGIIGLNCPYTADYPCISTMFRLTTAMLNDTWKLV